MEIFIAQGAEKGKNFNFENDMIYIGRSPKNDVQIRDHLVSRKHLKICRKDNQYTITDLHSSNGTFINNHKIPPGTEIEIEEGVPILIGVSILSVGQPSGEASPEPVDPSLMDKKSQEINEPARRSEPTTYKNNMDLIYKVADLMRESLDLNDTIHQILDHILNLLKRVDRITILLIDEETQGISDAFFMVRNEEEGNKMDYNEEVVNQVMKDREDLIISDVYADADIGFSSTLKLMKIGSVMCIPLISRGNLRGVLYLDTIDKTKGFRTEDMYLLKAVGSTLALAVENYSIH